MNLARLTSCVLVSSAVLIPGIFGAVGVSAQQRTVPAEVEEQAATEKPKASAPEETANEDSDALAEAEVGEEPAEPVEEPTPTDEAAPVDKLEMAIEAAEAAGIDIPVVEELAAGPWVQEVNELADDILRGQADRTQADALFAELKVELLEARNRLRDGLASGAPTETLEERHQELEDLYDARLLLLKEVSPVLRVRLTGLGADGVREAQEEFDRLQLHMRYQAALVPDKARDLGSDLRTSPIPILSGLAALIFAIIVFRLWRRWADKNLPAMRKKLLTARPRSRRNVRFAKALWYLGRLRGPIEWLILLGVIASVIRPSDAFQEEDPLWVIIKWVFIGWLGWRLVDAIATRGGAGLGKDDSGLRQRSLKLIWTWIAAFGMGLELADEYVGDGTLYSWVWKALLFLGLLVLLVLINWWRDEIFIRLARDPHPPAWIQRLLVKNKERKGYLGTALGGAYLLLRGLRRGILRLFSKVEVGRRVLAHVFRQEIERQTEAQRLAVEGEPLPDHLRDKLLTGGNLVSKAHRKQKRAILELAEGDPGWFIAISGERGLGKSTLLRRIRSDLGDRMAIIDCPITGYQDLLSAIKSSVGLSADHGLRLEGLKVALQERKVDMLAIDNVHRVASPRIGGLDDIERLLGLVRDLGRSFSWIFTLDSLAWQYISAARYGASGNTSVVELDSWSEEDIGELMTNSAAAAGIEPDFERLVLPRQLDEMAYEAETDRKRHGFSRILWYASDGNPGVALRHWADSLRILDNGKVAVHLFEQARMADLDDLNLTNQFILRSLAQMEYATLEDVLEATRLPHSEVQSSIRGLLVRGLVEIEEGMLHLSWDWYRMITTLLRRQNLLTTD